MDPEATRREAESLRQQADELELAANEQEEVMARAAAAEKEASDAAGGYRPVSIF